MLREDFSLIGVEDDKRVGRMSTFKLVRVDERVVAFGVGRAKYPGPGLRCPGIVDALERVELKAHRQNDPAKAMGILWQRCKLTGRHPAQFQRRRVHGLVKRAEVQPAAPRPKPTETASRAVIYQDRILGGGVSLRGQCRGWHGGLSEDGMPTFSR